MKKKVNILGADDIEFSDEELRNLERELKGDKKSELSESEAGAMGGDDVDLDELEREIMNMGKGEESGKKEYNPLGEDSPKKDDKSVQPPKESGPNPNQLIQWEDEFHGLPCIFGQAIDDELEKVIPPIKAEFEKNSHDSAIDYVIKLSRKEGDLVKFKAAIADRASKGEMTPEKYKGLVEKAIGRNNEAMSRAKTAKLPQSQLNRILHRLELLGSELKMLEQSPEEEQDSITLPVVNEPEQEPAVPGPSSHNLTNKLLDESRLSDFNSRPSISSLKPSEPILPSEPPAKILPAINEESQIEQESEIQQKTSESPKKEKSETNADHSPIKETSPQKNNEKSEEKKIPELVKKVSEELKKVSEDVKKPSADDKNPSLSEEVKKPADYEKKSTEEKKKSGEDAKTGTEDGKKVPAKNNPVLVHFAQKIALFMRFHDYLQEHFVGEREKDITAIGEKIKKMRELLSRLKSGKETRTIEEIDSEFVSLDAKTIIGLSRDERNKKIDQLIHEMKHRVEVINETNLKKACMVHYVEVIKSLQTIGRSQFGVLPKMGTKLCVFDVPDSNPQLEPSNFFIRPVKVHPVLDKRYFYIAFELSHNDKKFVYESEYCASGGAFNCFNIIDLGDDFTRGLMKASVKCTLFKKKFYFSKRPVSTSTFNLQKLASLCSFTVTLEFPYKNNTVINAEVQVKVRKPFGKPQKEVEITYIQTNYPVFSLEAPQPQTHEPQPEKKEPQMENTTPKSDPKDQKPDKKEQPPSKDQPDYENAKFEYPLVPANVRQRLLLACQKSGMPTSFVEFEEKCFCMTFLEEFTNELENQIPALTINGDRETAKLGQNFFKSCHGYLKSLTKGLQDGTMTREQYEDNLAKRLEVDKQVLDFHTKAKTPQAIAFLTKRIKTISDELEQLRS